MSHQRIYWIWILCRTWLSHIQHFPLIFRTSINRENCCFDNFPGPIHVFKSICAKFQDNLYPGPRSNSMTFQGLYKPFYIWTGVISYDINSTPSHSNHQMAGASKMNTLPVKATAKQTKALRIAEQNMRTKIATFIISLKLSKLSHKYQFLTWLRLSHG